MAIKIEILVFLLNIAASYVTLIRCDVVEVNLGGTWIVTNANKSISVHGNVPGNVHTALYKNGTIKDPYFRFNDVKYRWIAYDNWTYTRSLEGVIIFFFNFSFLLTQENETAKNGVSRNTQQLEGHCKFQYKGNCQQENGKFINSLTAGSHCLPLSSNHYYTLYTYYHSLL